MICLLVAADRVHAQTAPGAPTIDSVTATATSLTVVWSAPSDDGGSAINFYDLRYIESDAPDASKADDANWILEEDAWTTGTLSYEIAGLRDSTGYDVQVRAENSDLAGDWSSTSTGTTNDHGATISSATAITLDSSVHGRVHVTGDEDYFELVLGSATDLLVYTTGDFDTAGAVRNSVGATTVSNDDGGLPPDPAHLAIREELAAGTWYISVDGNGAQQTGSYTLHVRAAAAASTIATATEVGLDALVPGTLSAGGVHFFRIEPTSATDLWVLAIGDTDTKGELLDSSQSVIAQNDDSELTNNESSFSLRASVEADETYYIKVQGGDSDAAGSYILYVRSVAGPGDSSATASPLMLTLPAPGRIDATEDEDYFSLTLESTTYVLLEAHDHGGTLHLTPTLFDSQDMEIDLYYLNEGGWPAIDGKDLSLWAVERLPAGTYTIRIEGATSDTGAYVLHASVAADAVAEEEACLALGTSQNDPLYGCEWHLDNTGQFGSGAGYDINVEAAWETTLGEGVNVVIVDEGLDYLHSDLRGYEYESADPDDDTMGHHDITGLGVRYPGAVHGTQVAGIIAGRDNDIGVRGVAPRATIYGYNLWGGISQRPGLANEANAAAHLADVTAVSNNSWRLPSFGTMRIANSDWEMAVEEGVRSGYDGKGVFYVWIAGNGHPQNNANLDERQNHYAVTTVCAVDYNDVRSGYSELGANLWICAPSQDKDADLPGIATTSVGNTYDLNFTGTSAAAPIVSGVAALVRAANRDLFWRDVKLILATSARKNDPTNTGWQDGALKYGSADEHYSFSHEYGFGVVDAGAAVALANNWTPLPAFREVSATASPALAIPDLPSSGTADAVSSSVTLGPHVGFVEFLAIELGLTHRNYRDLRIELVSPTGATSTLLPPDVEASRSSDKRADDVTYRLGSARHLGEQAAGEWTLRITDERTGDRGRLHSWKLTAYGHGYIPDSPSITSANAGPGAITLAWTAPDDTGTSAVSAYDVRYIRSAEADKADNNWTEVEDAWSSGDLEYEVGGLVGAVGYDLQVRAVNDQGAGGWSETIEATTPTVPGAAAITGVSPRDGELVVTWSAPADDGGIAIERYDLRYIESNATDKADANWIEQASIWTSTVGGDLRDLISLVNGTAYDLQVRAANGAGSGEWSATVAGTPAIQNHDPEFPATEDGARSVDENTPAGQNIGAPVQAPDRERDALSYTLSGADAASFDIVATSGQLRTKGALDHEDTAGYSVTVQVSDGTNTNGETDPAIDDLIGVIITIDDVPERPELSGPAHVTREENGTAYVGRYSATDPEGTIVTWVALAGPDAGHFGLSEAGDLSFTTVPDYEARPSPHNVYRVTVRASDADGTVGTLPVAVTVTDMNEAPAISGPDTIDIDEGHAEMLGDYASEDPEGGTVNWGSVGDAVALGGADAGAFEFDQLTGRLTFASPPDFEQGKAQYQVTLHANDGELTGELAITVNVENVEEPGSLTLGARLGVLNVALIATLQDPDGIVSEMWQWQRSMSLTGVWADIANTDSGSYTPVAADRDHYLNATVTYTDGHGPGKTARAATEFTTANQRGPSNNPPQLPDAVDDITIPEDSGGGRMVGTVTASDLDNDPLTYELSGASEFAIGRESGQIVVADGAAFDFETDPVRYMLTVTADDGFGGSDTVEVTIHIENVNEPPTAVPDARETPEDEPITIEVLTNVSDPDRNDTLTLVRLGERPLHGTATVQSGANEIHYRPHEDYHGADNFSYVVRDGAGLTATGSVSITIEPLNDAPVFPAVTAERSVSEVAEEGTEVGAPVAASDVDGNSLSYGLAGGAAHFEIDEFTGQIRVAPGAMLDATTDPTHTVTVTADDQSGEPNARATIEVTITVSEGPVTPPVIFTGGGGAPSGPSPSEVDFEWNVTRDIEELDSGHDDPTGAWSDGATLWLLENGSGADDAIYAYDLESGERVPELEFELDDANLAPRGVWSDRTTIWISDSGKEKLFAHDLASGERLPDSDLALHDDNDDTRGIWSDDSTMWVLDDRDDALFGYDLESGALLAEYALHDDNDDPYGIFSDGVSVWVSDDRDKRLFAYRLPAPDAAASEEEDLELERVTDEEFKKLSDASNNSPRGIWSDGDVMYVADESDGKVYTYNMPDGIDARLASLTLSGVDIGEFSSSQTEYEAVVADGVTETTVEAETVQSAATVAIAPADTDEDIDGYQAALDGLEEVTITVTSADESRTKVYRARFGDAAEEEQSNTACLLGAVNTGLSLVVYGGGSVEDLEACAQSRSVTALYVPHEGEYVPYILGAPGFVNEAFAALYADGLPALTPLIARSEGPPSPPPASDDAPEFGPDCLRGAIATGLSLLLYEGGSVEELDSCAQGREVSAVYALVEGEYVPYILGAPEFVNEAFAALFPEGLAAVTPLVAKSD